MKDSLSRRDFIKAGGAFGVRVAVGSSLFAATGCDWSLYGPLLEPDENGIRLPHGFRSRVLARSGDVVEGSNYIWHGAPDGGAVFRSHKGWTYVSNSERLVGGGVGALRFDRAGRVTDAYSICSGTRRNCAGGATPWGTWLTCEEVGTGWVWECDPQGVADPVLRPWMGLFNHEAVAVDPVHRHLYLTEDRPDGRLYRFTPNAWGDLSGGVLEVAENSALGMLTWHVVPNPAPIFGGTQTRHQVPQSTRFNGGEGIAYSEGKMFFATKGDDRIWELELSTQRLRVVYHRATDTNGGLLRGVDNVAITPDGKVLVAEDRGNMELVLLDDNGVAMPLLRVEGQPFSELTGPAFDPKGHRLYFSSQRGADGRGITYEVRGPFRSRRHRRRKRHHGREHEHEHEGGHEREHGEYGELE